MLISTRVIHFSSVAFFLSLSSLHFAQSSLSTLFSPPSLHPVLEQTSTFRFCPVMIDATMPTKCPTVKVSNKRKEAPSLTSSPSSPAAVQITGARGRARSVGRGTEERCWGMGGPMRRLSNPLSENNHRWAVQAVSDRCEQIVEIPSDRLMQKDSKSLACSYYPYNSMTVG
jgi:hypothetical protein